MSKKWFAVALALALSGSCGRIHYDGLWDHFLLVSISEDRLAGPETMTSVKDLDPNTQGLSLREAITIANNSPGSDLILFDSKVFRPGSGTAILLDTGLPVISGSTTSIDARENEVSLTCTGCTAIQLEGDSILVRGIHFEAPSVEPQIHILGGDQILIEKNSFSGTGLALYATTTDGLRIEGNELTATNRGFEITESTNLTIADNTLTDLVGEGMSISKTNSVQIRNNKMERVGANQVVVVDGSEIAVEFNEIMINNKTTDKGVVFRRVINSRICDNFIDPGVAHLISLSDSDDNLIEGNILDRGDAGIVLEGTSSRNMVFRNVVVGSAYDGIYVSSTAMGNTLVHNTIHNARSPIVASDASMTVQGNNLTTDVDFVGYVDAANYDFHLSEGSEFVDAGEDLGYDCVPDAPELYWGAAPDLGAVETR